MPIVFLVFGAFLIYQGEHDQKQCKEKAKEVKVEVQKRAR